MDVKRDREPPIAGNDAQPSRPKLMFRFWGPEETITRRNIQECFYITPIENLDNILAQGIVSHKRVEKINPGRKDVSNQEVQKRRARRVIERVDPAKRPRSLHRFVNLYLNPHNAMMINIIHGKDPSIKQDRTNMCVLRIRGEILDRGDAVLTNENAATNAVDFFTVGAYELDAKRAVAMLASKSTGHIDLERNPHFRGDTSKAIGEFRRQTRQAEALLPYRVDPRYIFGLWVCDQATRERVIRIVDNAQRSDITTAVNAELFLPTEYAPLMNYPARAADDAMDDIDPELPSSDESDDDTTYVTALRRGGGP